MKKVKSKKFHLKKGDIVKIIAGENRGEEGKVLEILSNKAKAIVEGKNLVSKHTKPNTANPQGGIIKQEAGIHMSNLMLVDPKSKAASRVGRRKNAKGESVRYFKKSGEEVKS